MIDRLKGTRTKLANLLATAQPVLLMLGIEFDIALIQQWFNEMTTAAVILQGGLHAAVHYFRDQANADA